MQDKLNTHTKGSFYAYLSVRRAGALSELIDFEAVKISWSFSVEAAIEKLNRSYQQVNQQN